MEKRWQKKFFYRNSSIDSSFTCMAPTKSSLHDTSNVTPENNVYIWNDNAPIVFFKEKQYLCLSTEKSLLSQLVNN